MLNWFEAVFSALVLLAGAAIVGLVIVACALGIVIVANEYAGYMKEIKRLEGKK